MHISKLATVALIKYDNNLSAVSLMILVLFNKGRKFLNRRNDNV